VFTKELNTPVIGEGELLIHKIYKTKLLLQTRTFNDKESFTKLREESSLRLMITDPIIDRLIAFSSIKHSFM